MNTANSYVSRIMDYEQGLMSEEEMVDLFQDLIDSGVIWSLQGSYSRVARQLIKSGLCRSVSDHEVE